MNAQVSPALAPVTTAHSGKFLLFRKHGGGMRHTPRGSLDAGRPPRHRHNSLASAEGEARRLLGLYPESTFLILQEVGRVKLKPAKPAPSLDPDDMPDAVTWATTALDHIGRSDPDAATGCADDQTFAAVPVAAVREALS
jgi:hypothetical protein